MRPKYLEHSKTMLITRNKPDMKKKGFEMVEIVEAASKELR